MRLTHKSEYAIVALIHLARLDEGKKALASEIANEKHIPKKFLQQILNELKQSRHIFTSRGKGGGYKLAKPASEITVAEIVRLFDGAIAPTSSSSKFFYAPSPVEKETKALNLFQEIRTTIAEKLESVTIQNLV